MAFLFPGQGSQYPDAAAETALYLQGIGEALAQADLQLDGQFPKRLAQYLYPPASFSQEQKKLAAEELTQTRVAQPVIGALSCGFLDVLSLLGVEPDFLGGHSYGEYTALHAAGVISREEFFQLSAIRGKAMQSACEGSRGGMAAVAGSREDVAKRIAGTPIVIANHNGPRETVISGPMDALEKILADLKNDELPSKLLPVAGAFHSSLMQEAQRPLVEAFATVTFRRPHCSVFSNSNARPYPLDLESIRRQLESHMLSPVEFVGEIEAMYESGARIFIEVGPRNILSSLVAEILKDRGDTIIVALDPQRGALRGFLNALGRLYVEGLPIDLKAIFAARQESDLSAAHSPPRNRDWLLSGGGVRKPHESAGLSGKNPLLTFASLSEQTHPTPAAPSRLNNQQTEIMTNPKEPLSEPPRPQNGGGAGNRPYETALQAYADYQETMRQFLKVQEEVMKQFLARETSGVAPATSIKEIDAAPARFQPAPAQNGSSLSMPPVVNGSSESRKEPVETAVPDAGAAGHGREDLTKILLDLVSERTGYPPEMLGLDQDLEADLGIDSIKRVEIVGAFQNQLPPIFVQKLTRENHDLSRVRTLNGWVDVLVAPTDVALSR